MNNSSTPTPAQIHNSSTQVQHLYLGKMDWRNPALALQLLPLFLQRSESSFIPYCSPLFAFLLYGMFYMQYTVHVVFAVPKSGSAQLLGLHCFSEQYTEAEISAIPQEQVVLHYTCTISSSAINLVLGSWYKRHEGLKDDKYLLFCTNRRVCVH